MGGGPEFSYTKGKKAPISAVRKRALQVEAEALERLVNTAFKDWIGFMLLIKTRQGMDSERFGQFLALTKAEIKKYEADQESFFMG